MLLPSIAARISGRVLARLLLLALHLTLDLDDLVLEGSVERRVAHRSFLEEIALPLRDVSLDLPPGDVVEHDREDLVEGMVRVAVSVVDSEHLIRVDELVADVAVEVAYDPGLLRLDLEVLDGGMNVDCLLEVASLGGRPLGSRR